jgi:hypothetical protein
LLWSSIRLFETRLQTTETFRDTIVATVGPHHPLVNVERNVRIPALTSEFFGRARAQGEKIRFTRNSLDHIRVDFRGSGRKRAVIFCLLTKI